MTQSRTSSSSITAILVALAAISLPSEAAGVALKEAKLIIEHNATDKDTGFQGALDGEGWRDMTVKGPGGVVLKFEAGGKLRGLGLTELFFESVEPLNADVPIKDMLARLPAGNYTFSGPTAGGGTTSGTALFTHDIPKGPTLLSPPAGSSVAHADLQVAWTKVTRSIEGKPIDIIAYQLIVERDQPPHPHMIGKLNGLSMYLPPSVTRMTVPKAFLAPNTKYSWEVLAIETSGNQTLSSSDFSTR